MVRFSIDQDRGAARDMECQHAVFFGHIEVKRFTVKGLCSARYRQACEAGKCFGILEHRIPYF